MSKKIKELADEAKEKMNKFVWKMKLGCYGIVTLIVVLLVLSIIF